MIAVNVQHSNNSEEYSKNFEKALKQFKRQVNDDGFITEIQDRRYFKKPSEKNREDRRRKDRLFAQLKNSYKKDY